MEIAKKENLKKCPTFLVIQQLQMKTTLIVCLNPGQNRYHQNIKSDQFQPGCYNDEPYSLFLGMKTYEATGNPYGGDSNN